MFGGMAGHRDHGVMVDPQQDHGGPAAEGPFPSLLFVMRDRVEGPVRVDHGGCVRRQVVLFPGSALLRICLCWCRARRQGALLGIHTEAACSMQVLPILPGDGNPVGGTEVLRRRDIFR